MAVRSARRGVFGRLPTVAPSLSSTLVSIAREMQNQMDQNITSAWQKGGTWLDPNTGTEVQVTDQRLLQYWNDRLKGIAKDDPIYDVYEQNVQQLDYTIAESKMTAAYATGAEGAPDDNKMAAFYLGWAKKINPNSEFYRVLQRDAGQYIQRAKTNASNNAATVKENVYQTQKADIGNKYIQAANYLWTTLNTLAQTHNLIPGGGSVQDFDPTEPGAFLQLLDMANGQKEGAGNNLDNKLYDDPVTRKPVTLGDVLAQLHKYDPSISATSLSEGLFTNLIDRANQGLQLQLNLAQQSGHASDVTAIQKSIAGMAEFRRETTAWPIEQSYQDYRDAFTKVWNDDSSTPAAKLAAYKTYMGQLGSLENDPRIATDDETKQALADEIAGTPDRPNLASTFTFLSTPSAAAAGDSAATLAGAQKLQNETDAVNAGQGVWTTGTRDAQGNFQWSPTGTAIGFATANDVVNMSDGTVQTFSVPNGNGGFTQVQVAGLPISVAGSDSVGTPAVVDPGQPGSVFAIPGGPPTPDGQPTSTPLYSVLMNGIPVYSTVPFTDPSTTYNNQSDKGLTIGLKGSPTLNPDGTWSIGGAVIGSSASTSTFGYYVTADPNNQNKLTLRLNPTVAMAASDPSRFASGQPNPATDSILPDIAKLLGTKDGQAQLAQLSRDPNWINSQLAQAAQITATAGLQGPGGVNLTLQQAQDQILTAMGGVPTHDIGAIRPGANGNGMGTFGQKVSIDGVTPSILPHGAVPAAIDTNLPSDHPSAPPAISGLYHPGTNYFTGRGGLSADNRGSGPMITTGPNVVVPGNPYQAPPHGAVPAVSPYTPPAQQGVTTGPGPSQGPSGGGPQGANTGGGPTGGGSQGPGGPGPRPV